MPGAGVLADMLGGASLDRQGAAALRRCLTMDNGSPAAFTAGAEAQAVGDPAWGSLATAK